MLNSTHGVAGLREMRGVMSKQDYDEIRKYAEKAREQVEQARIALETHIAEHGCRPAPYSRGSVTTEAAVGSLLSGGGYQVLQVPVIFLANILQNFLIGIPGRLRYNRPGLGVILRIFDGGFNLECI